MAVTMEAVQAALSGLIDPNTQKDYVSTRSAKNIKLEGDKVSLDIEPVSYTHLDVYKRQ